MFVATRRFCVLAKVLVLALLVLGTLCAPAFAAAPRILGSVSKPYPKTNSIETVYARALNAKGKPAEGVRITFTWRIGGRIVVLKATTNRKGVAHTTHTIGWSSIWRNHVVSLSGRMGGKTRRGGATYVPIPVVNSGNLAQVNLGIAGPLTEGATEYGQGLLRGAKLAIEQANASTVTAGLGLHFGGIPADDNGDPRTAVEVAGTLVSDARVLGVVGHLNSGCSIPASKLYADHDVPMISPFSTNPALTYQGLRTVFRTTYTDAQQGPSAANAAWNLGKRRAYVVDDSTPYGGILASGFRTQFVADGGAVPGIAKTSDKDTDFTSLVPKIKSTNPDVVYYGGIYNAGALLAKQLHDAGVTAPVLGGDGLYDAEYISLGGTSVDGDMATSVGYPPTALPDGAAFLSAYHAGYPSAELTDADAYAYDAANVLISAIIADAQKRGAAMVGTPADRARTTALISATDMEGATGRIRFNARGDRLDPKIALYKVIAGSWVYQGVN